jgi:hypothetical protein
MALFNLGMILSDKGRLDEALSCLKQGEAHNMKPPTASRQTKPGSHA